MSIVKNINGTSQNVCTCGSWYKHWRKFSGYDLTYCSEASCLNKNPVGAHVQKANSTDNNWYIVPLCVSHNKSEITLDVESTTLVSANKSLTCEKQ